MADYRAECAGFSWAGARRLLEGLPGGGLNIAHEAVDRHARGPLRDAAAVRFLRREGECRALTYCELQELTNRFANLLRRLGVAPGEPVATLCGRVPELWVSALGSLKAGCVFCPLYAAFGPEPIRVRLELARARVLVAEATLYRRKVAEWADALPALEHVLVFGDEGPPDPRCADWQRLLRQADPRFETVATRAEDPAILHFTSGTTGRPKGALHVHESVLGHLVSARYALDLHPGDLFWCTADPGWVTGTSYGIVAPLAAGATSVVDESAFDPARWYRILQEQRVAVWYTAPTAVRMLMRAGEDLARGHDFSRLRLAASVGEPLGPEAVIWGQEVLGRPFHDTWWQTETGAIMIANCRCTDIRPGSMGRPLPGIEAAVVRREGEGEGAATPLEDIEATGELALRRGWPSMFRGYLDDPERYRRCFAGDWYLTGDLVRRDREGYFWFLGRRDDLIKCAGHLIGPFEVESVLTEHPAVAEAAAVGKPDPVAFEVVKAFVVLRRGHAAGEALRRDILAHARRRLGPVVAPKDLEFRPDLPRTRSGKILRRLLRSQERGEPPGDLSALAQDDDGGDEGR
jgi:acetyl-CoA synthetase